MIKTFDNGTDNGTDKKIDTWLIMAASKTIAGKIIARYARTLTVLSITFFETDSTPDVGTMEIMDGCGNEITTYGIGSLLWRLRDLKQR